MTHIHLFSKISAIFLALILVTSPVASALATGYNLNNKMDSDDPDITYENLKYTGPVSSSKDSTEIDSSKNNAKDNENSRKNQTDCLISLQPIPTFPLDLKQQAYEIISSINPVKNTNNNDIIEKLDTVELHIARSIDNGAWYDRSHLKPVVVSYEDYTEGDTEFGINTTVFRDERTAVRNILEIISKNKDATIDDELLKEVLINLIQADRNIAQTAITDAQRASSLPAVASIANIEKAQKSFDKANEQIAKGEPIDAIRHFEKAWEYATTELVRMDAASTPVIIFDLNNYTPQLCCGWDKP